MNCFLFFCCGLLVFHFCDVNFQDQYQFAHKAVVEYIKYGVTEITVKEFYQKAKHLRQAVAKYFCDAAKALAL